MADRPIAGTLFALVGIFIAWQLVRAGLKMRKGRVAGPPLAMQH